MMGMVSKKSDVYKDIKESFGQVPTWLKDVPDQALSGFWSVMKDFYLAETALPNKTKELIGIAVSGATRCRYCQLFHTEAARLFGATDVEIAEAAMMSGVTMMASSYINAIGSDYDQFRRETLEIVSYIRAHHPSPGKRPSGSTRETHTA
jgi:AhpD family alkylhydroperoxidase